MEDIIQPEAVIEKITTTDKQESVLKTDSSRLNASEWNMIEAKATNFNDVERLVQSSLIKLGNSEDATVADELITVIGDKFYYKIRHLLKDFNISNKISSYLNCTAAAISLCLCSIGSSGSLLSPNSSTSLELNITLLLLFQVKYFMFI